MKLYNLTPGLLASAAMRANHAMFMPDMDWGQSFMMESWETRIPKGLRKARENYGLATLGRLSDLQVLEEFEGKGFYAPEREDQYMAMLAAFPGMTDIAQEIVSSSPG